MIIPHYRHNNIVNLMSSILESSGSKSLYPTLSSLPPAEIKKYKNIVLVVIDGRGQDQVASLPKESFLKRNLQGKLSSVFPPTTTAAVTTFLTGVAPQNHG
ncbi:MAG TPA: phosphodiesterase, partial [Candidatus Nanoarchaeia archaeon]|nr:phosphodiesterase [Candidatus Nanoarchaeia archaeon]